MEEIPNNHPTCRKPCKYCQIFTISKILQKPDFNGCHQQVDIDESGTLDSVELRKLIRKFQEKVRWPKMAAVGVGAVGLLPLAGWLVKDVKRHDGTGRLWWLFLGKALS